MTLGTIRTTKLCNYVFYLKCEHYTTNYHNIPLSQRRQLLDQTRPLKMLQLEEREQNLRKW
jgi:hypothetical protein